MSYQGNCDWDYRPQEIGYHRQRATTFESKREKLERIESPPTALAIGVNTLGDFMTIVVVLRQSACTAISSAVRTILL